jgi:hypothetical protein
MSQTQEFLRKAVELEKLANTTRDPLLKLSYADQAQSYRMLALDTRSRVVNEK